MSFKDKNITKHRGPEGQEGRCWGFGNEAELYAGLRKAGIDPANKSDVNIIAQQFDMVAFGAGEIDAAQAMIYNEYAQVLETINPKTKKLYTADDLNVISWEQVGTSMLRGRDLRVRMPAQEDGQRGHRGQVPDGLVQGLDLLRDNPAECVDIVLKHDAKLPKGHQTWQLNEVSNIIWPAPKPDRDHRQGRLRPHGPGGPRWQDPDQAGHRAAVAQ